MTVTTLAVPDNFTVDRIDYVTQANAIIIYFKPCSSPPPPTPDPQPLKQVQILGAAGSYLNIRTGPGTTFMDIGNALAGTIETVYETQHDGAGNEWVRIRNDQQWVCRVLNGVEKAKWL